MHTNGNLRTMSAAAPNLANNARRDRTSKKKEAQDMGPAAIMLSILAVGALLTNGKLLVWAVIAFGVWFVYERISSPSRLILVAASAVTALSFLVQNVFSAWY